jgi:DNA-directed RNA polymerase subunit RPC12/RpoP
MKNTGIPHQYACFKCRKSFKRKQFFSSVDRFMTSDQQAGQYKESADFNAKRIYKCPDCGDQTYFVGTDFKAPKKSDTKAWREAKILIESGKVYYRGNLSDSP